MKLRNKKTGEIKEIKEILIDGMFKVKSLTELNEEWEDYKEPKEYWYYDTTKNGVEKIMHLEDKEKDQEIGNYFETKEEAEKAVERLRAWKRLKDKGFRFIPEFHRIEEGNDERGNVMCIACTMDDDKDFIYGDNKDLKLLFGDE